MAAGDVTINAGVVSTSLTTTSPKAEQPFELFVTVNLKVPGPSTVVVETFGFNIVPLPDWTFHKYVSATIEEPLICTLVCVQVKSKTGAKVISGIAVLSTTVTTSVLVQPLTDVAVIV